MAIMDDATVFVVDDDADLRRSLHCLLRSVNLSAELFDSAASFLAAFRADRPGCLLLDVRLPGMSGLQLLEHLYLHGPHPPVILFSGHADVPMVLQAMNYGVFAFLEKPAPPQQLLDHVQAALAADRETHDREWKRAIFQNRLNALSLREQQVLARMIDGQPNKAMAMELGISERTLEKHRKHVHEKLGARTLPELIRLLVLHQQGEAK